jgi:hypothetical protein
VTVAVAVRWGAEHRPRVERTAVVGLAALALVLAGAGATRAASADPPEVTRDAEVADVSRQLIARLPPGDDPVLLRAASPRAFEDMKGVTLALEQAGIGVRVPQSHDNRLTFGASRADRHGRVRGLYVIVTDAEVDGYRRRENREVAYVGSVGPAEHSRLFRRYERLRRRGAAALGPEFARIAGRLHAIAVFSVPRFPHDRTN